MKNENAFENLFNDNHSLNRYISNDGTESWFDYKIDDVNYYCEKLNYGKCFYRIGAWFDNRNINSLNQHICRFQVESTNFTTAFNKIKKLVSQKEIIFDGGYDFYKNTSGSYWKHTSFRK